METNNKEMKNMNKMIELNCKKAVKNKYMKTLKKFDKQMENLIIKH